MNVVSFSLLILAVPETSIFASGVLALAPLASGVPFSDDLAPPPNEIVVERACESPAAPDSSYERLYVERPGTLRLQVETGPRARWLSLGIDPAELDIVVTAIQGDLDRLRRRGGFDPGSTAPESLGGEVCRLWVKDGDIRQQVEYATLDTLSLELARIDQRLDEFARRVRENPAPTWNLRQLEIGSLLRRRSDGVVFEYTRSTDDERGAELRGVVQPLVLFTIRDELPKHYDLVGDLVEDLVDDGMDEPPVGLRR